MFNRTAQSIYKPLTLGLILAVGLIMLAHIGHTKAGEPEVWFSFGGNKANVAEDASGNGNDGVIMGGAKRVPSKEGPYGMGIELSDSLEQFIEFDYLMTDPGTVEFWFKPYWDGKDAGTYRLFDANNAVVFFSIGKGAVIGERETEFHFAVEDVPDTDFYVGVQAADFVKKDTWMHIAATWDFGGDAFFYIDGEEVATAKGFAGFPNFMNPQESEEITSLSTEPPRQVLTVLLMNSLSTAKFYPKRTSRETWTSLSPMLSLKVNSLLLGAGLKRSDDNLQVVC